MPTITFTENASGTGTSILSVFEEVFGGSPVISPISPSQFVATVGTTQLFVIGNNFNSLGGVTIDTGTIQSIQVNDISGAPTTLLSFSDLNLDVATLLTAIALDDVPPNDAVEALFLGMDWTYNGNSGADLLSVLDASSDGVPINLMGNDLFNLGGGNDDFFAGNGNDRMNGGTGDDTMFGGEGRDVLRGGHDNDVLVGGANGDGLRGGRGDDNLQGGQGRDGLNGGSGDDTLNGGEGRDAMRGGTGADTFVFASGDGDDIIRDLNTAEDVIEIANGGALISFTTTATSVIIGYTGGSIEVEGTTDALAVSSVVTDTDMLF